MLLGLFLTMPMNAVAQTSSPSSENAFATDLYATLSQKPGNLFFSPYSLFTALGMAFVGADGNTADEIAKTLHENDLRFQNDPTARRVAFLKNMKQLREGLEKTSFEFHAANALWGQGGYPFHPMYGAAIKDNFKGSLEVIDFKDEHGALSKINAWVSRQTKAKILDLIPQGVLSASTRLVLTDAVYFKAAWAHPFLKGATRKGVFHGAEGRNIPVPMMTQTGSFLYAEEGSFRLLVVPYKDDDVSMLVFLPRKQGDLERLEAQLTAENVQSWLEKVVETNVALSLPKFKSASTFSLVQPLAAMGMEKAFSPKEANFAPMVKVPNAGLFLSDVRHKAFVDVDEEGTEAAAATAVIMMATAMPVMTPPVSFVVDHPFLYVVRANTGAILFMGRMTNPAL